MPESNVKNNYFLINVELLPRNVSIPFEIFVYMPENDKMLLYRQVDSTIPQAKWEQMKKFTDRFFINKSDEDKYNHFLSVPKDGFLKTVKQAVGTPSDKLSEGTKEELQLKSAELLMSSFSLKIDPNSSKTPVEQASEHIQKVADEVFELLEVDDGLLAKVQALQKAMEASNWNHSLNTAVISTLFALSIGYTDKKLLRDISTGAYLHDIGLAANGLTQEVRLKEYEGEKLRLYRDHPRAGLEMIESLELPVSEEVKLIIYQHEEHYDGRGYPMGAGGTDIFEPAQIVAIANYMDELIRKDQKNPLEADKALYKIAEDNSSGGTTRFNPILIQQIVDAALSSGAMKLEEEAS